MKTFLVLLAIIGGISARSEKFEKARDECAKEFPVEEKLMKKVLTEGMTDVDENIKCHIKCIMEKMEHIDENGQVQIKEIDDEHKDPDHHAKIIGAFEKCKEIVVKNCDDAYKLKMCIWNEIKDTWKDN